MDTTPNASPHLELDEHIKPPRGGEFVVYSPGGFTRLPHIDESQRPAFHKAIRSVLADLQKDPDAFWATHSPTSGRHSH